MPVEINIDRNKNLSVISLRGHVEFKERLSAFESFYRNPTKHLIYDKSVSDGHTISGDEIHRFIELVNLNKDKRKNGKTAIVSSAKADYGISRMFELIAEAHDIPWDIQCFMSIEEASTWIQEESTPGKSSQQD